jgi:Domain of unknown function (DUF6457)
MTAEEWIAAYARELGQPEPSREEMDRVLALAGTAAHASERRAAPIACWLAARSDITLEEAQAVAERLT